MYGRGKEEKLNVYLADALKEYEVDCESETTIPGYGGKRPDVLVKLDKIYVVIEAKIGDNKQNYSNAEEQCKKRISHGIAQKGIGVCYLNGISSSSNAREEIKTTPLSISVIQSAKDEDIQWNPGKVSDIVDRLKGLNGEETVEEWIVNILEHRLQIASRQLKEYQEAIRNVLHLHEQRDLFKATKIAMLILTNAIFFHDRLKDVKDEDFKKKVAHIRRPDDILKYKSQSVIKHLIEDWEKILRIDYIPIFKSAKAILKCLGETKYNALQAITELIQGTLQIKGKILSYDNDLPGRIYHKLLDTAKNDGSYYTSTPAAYILAHLALPEKGFIDWTNKHAISNLKICDPACGTGTLLSACKSICETRGGGGTMTT